METQEFGARLKELRKQAGLSQRQLADKVGVSFTYLSKIESGVMPPPSENIIAQLAEALKADEDELMILAGKLPADIARDMVQILKNQEALQFLRSDRTQRKIRSSNKKEGIGVMKNLVKYKNLSRAVIAVVLVVTVAASLWFAAPTPTKALTIGFPTLPSTGTLGTTYSFQMKITIETSEHLPVNGVYLQIYNVANSASYYDWYSGLPLATTTDYVHHSGSASNAYIKATADSHWGWFVATGYAFWNNQGYSWASGYGYGYQAPGTGATSITYYVNWTPPTGWPTGQYKAEATIATPNKNFTQTSGVFTLSVAVEEEVTEEVAVVEAPPVAAPPVEAPPVEVPPVEVPPEEVTPEDIEEMTTEEAAQAIEEMTTEKAAATIEQVATAKAAAVIEQVATTKAAAVIEQVSTAKSAAVIEQVATAKAAAVIGQVATAKAAAVMEQVSTAKAAAVMEQLTTEKLSAIVPAMTEKSLTERLPELSTAKLHSIAPKVLFNSLPNAPTEQLIAEEPPRPPAGLPAPVVVSTTPTEGKYRAAETQAGKWALVVGSPLPVDKLLIKTKQALKDVGTTIGTSAEVPAELATGLADKQITSAYLDITFENATPEDIDLGHLTFKVEKAWLEQNSIHKWSVVLSWYDPGLGQWISLPSKRVKEDETYVYYSAVITHFSKYAVLGSQVVPALEFKASNLVVSPTEAEIGQEVTVSADITNLSSTAGTYVASLWIDGTIETGKNVALQAGETARVSFTVTRQDTGSYEVRVDRLFEDFSVITKAPVVPPEEVVPEEAPAPLAWWVWLIIGLVVVAVIGVIIWLVIRRRAA